MSRPAGRRRELPDAALEVALWLLGTSACVAVLYAHAQQAVAGVPQWLTWSVVLCLPLASRALAGSARRAARIAQVAVNLLCIACVAGFVAAWGALGLLPGSAVAMLWLHARREDTAPAATLIGIGLLAVLACASARPTPGWLFVAALQLLLAVICAVLLNARHARRSIRSRGGRGAVLPETPPLLLRRLSSAAAMSVTVPLLVLALLAAQQRIIEHLRAAAEQEAQPLEDPAATTPPDPDDRSAALEDGFPDGLGATRAPQDGPDVRLMLVRLFDHATGTRVAHGRPFLLRGGILDQVTEAGFGAAQPAPQKVTGDGGWCRVGDGAAGDLEIRVRDQTPLVHQRDYWLLFGIDPWLAIRTPGTPAELVALREGVFAIQRGTARLLDYDVLTTHAAFDLASLPDPIGVGSIAGRRAIHADAQYSTVTFERADLLALTLALAERARDVTRDASDDLARVSAVVKYLKDHFRYNRSVAYGRDDFGALASLLHTGEGICSQFAMAATLMLRSLRLPVRVATGFLVQDYDADTAAYGVWDSNRHAWIEVHFDGHGWVPFDVTPADALGALLNAWRNEAEPAEVPQSIVPEHSLAALIQELLAAPRQLLLAARQRLPELLIAALILGVAGLLPWRLCTAMRRSRAELAGPAGGLYLRAVAALRRLCPPTCGVRTPRELAGAAAALAVDPCRDAPELVELLYRARFGRQPLSPAEFAAAERQVAAIESRARSLRRRGAGAEIRPPVTAPRAGEARPC